LTRSNVVLLILIDGLRHDYIIQEDSPFLFDLARQNVFGIVRETFAFQLRPAFFAGLYPEECDIAHLYYYDPDASPFASISKRTQSRDQLDRAVKKIEAKRGHSASAYYGSSSEIPFDLLDYFAFSEKYDIQEPGALGKHVTLFDQLRSAGKKWLWIAYPTHIQTTSEISKVFHSKIDEDDYSFIYLHFAEVDWAGHEYGPGSVQQRAALRHIDATICDVFATLNQRYADVRSIIFGDHGMVAVKKTVNVETRLKSLPFQAGQDYVYFLDSTQARFWFKNKLAQAAVTEMLESLPTGRILNEKDLAHLHFRFGHNKFGELIYVVDNEQVIFPNFFQREKLPLGMHGYLPEVVDNWAALVLAGVGRKCLLTGPIDMIEIYPTLLEMLGLSKGLLTGLPEKSRVVEPALDLSVIIPTYNRAENLSACLSHLQAQSYDHQRFEIIVIDDGSDDHTATVAADFIGKSDIATHYYRQQENRGPAAARNSGIEQAQGRLLLFIGDDTYADRLLIRSHVYAHQRWPEKGVAVLGHINIATECANSPFEVWNHKSGLQFAYEIIPELDDLGYTYFYASNVSVKANMLKTHGMYDESFKLALWEDAELAYRLVRQGLLLKYDSEAVVYHYHPTNLAKFAKRQYQAGKEAVRVWRKHSGLVDVVPNWSNPLLVLDEDRVAQLVGWAVDTDTALATGQVPDEDRAKKSAELLTLSRLLLEHFYALGFVQEIGTLEAKDLDLDDLPPDVAFLLREYQRLVEEKEFTFLHYGAPRAHYEALLTERGRLFVRWGRWLQDLSDRIVLALPHPIRTWYFRIRGLDLPENAHSEMS
jgi:glycosyltransferase involved in cell wall biosynthesis/predicted AlkP superfamily pyrophosphatase or phosphodiesterase